MNTWWFRGLILIVPFLFSQLATARPQYAVLNNNNSCTSCHFSPTGGGPRNRNGKFYQNRLFEANPFAAQDYVSADFRALYFRPEVIKTTKGGMGVMSGSVAGHIALDKKEKVQLVVEQNLAGFSAGPFRDTYVLYRVGQSKDKNWLDSVLVGRFRAPFGIISDEHRTYTRIQSGTQWYTFQNGILLSGNPSNQLHIDLAAVNGLNNSGVSLNDGQAEYFGGVLNIRYMPSFFMLGASARLNDTKQAQSTQAFSFYSVISLSRWSHQKVPVSLLLEGVSARGFNNNLLAGLASDPNYVNSVQNNTSQGLLSRVEWSLTPKLVLVYKYDWLLPDQEFKADYYERHGVGIRWNFAASSYFTLRNEWAFASHPSETLKSGLLSQDAIFGILEVSL